MFLLSGAAGFIAGWASFLAVVAFFHRMYKFRMIIRRAHKQHGVPIMPHSFLFGHLPVIIKVMMKRKVPQDLYPHFRYQFLAEEFPEVFEAGVLYLDTWPIFYPIMVVLQPEMVVQYAMLPRIPKAHFMRVEFQDFSDGRDILIAEGDRWKDLHDLFGPGFSSKNVLAMTPWFVEEGLAFRERLFRAAETKETVKLQNFAFDLTLDTISRAAFDLRVESQQHGEPPWLMAMREQVKLFKTSLDLAKELDPLRSWKIWRCNRICYAGIAPLVEEALKQQKQQQQQKHTKGPQSIMGLAAERIVRSGQPIPKELLLDLVNNMKMFLFAGHVTTTTALCMFFMLLWQNPEKLALVREEHDRVLGRDPARAAEVICADPSILNKLTYTAAAVKESMRLWPPVGGGTRESPMRDFALTNPETGMCFPTEGMVLCSGAPYYMRSPKYWHRRHEFLPERFLVRDPKDPLHPVKYAWAPFSLGPRSCIAQDLAQQELKLAAALTVREIDIETIYAADAPEFFGTKAYTIEDKDDVASVRVKDAMPIRVYRRETPVD